VFGSLIFFTNKPVAKAGSSRLEVSDWLANQCVTPAGWYRLSVIFDSCQRNSHIGYTLILYKFFKRCGKC